MPYKNNCVICNVEFDAKVQHKITCSLECRKLHFKNLYHKREGIVLEKSLNCVICNKEFTQKRVKQVTCSVQCSTRNLSKQNYLRLELILKECHFCKKEFKTKNKNTIFCSAYCINKHFNPKNDEVLLNCEYCKKDFLKPYHRRKIRFCSKTCSSSYNNSKADWEKIGIKISETKKEQYKNGKKHPWIDRKHSEITKEKISKMATIRLSDSKNNPMFGNNHSTKSKEKMSETRTRKTLDGHFNFGHEKGRYLSIKMGREMIYRSSWEKKAFMFLDNDDTVLIFNPEPFRIEYQYKQKRHYVPDILVIYTNGIQKLIEIKPSKFVGYGINQAKFLAAKKHCEEKGMIFEVWTEKEINGLILT